MVAVSQFADYRDIDAQINHICNRSPQGGFSEFGDTGQTADKRYSDDAVTESRRKAAYRIFDNIGANLSHPFWGTLSELVDLDYGDTIPPYFGEIGIPQILPTSRDEVYRTATSADSDEIESYVEDEIGAFSDLYGNGKQAADKRGRNRVLSPMALRYSTEQDVIQFTGAACQIPMILIPTGDDLADMMDNKMPVTLSALNVKLALHLLIKEGDNLFRVAQYLGALGEAELASIKTGATHVVPIDPQKLIALSQKMT